MWSSSSKKGPLGAGEGLEGTWGSYKGGEKPGYQEGRQERPDGENLYSSGRIWTFSFSAWGLGAGQESGDLA